MEDDDWSFALSASTSSRGYQSKSQSDCYYDYEEVDEDDDLPTDYPCPFCSEDFDLVAICFHIDEQHSFESKSWVCPACVMKVGMNMVELSTSKIIPDPLLSFIHNGPLSDTSASVQLGPSTEINSEEKHLDNTSSERNFLPSSTSDIDQKEKTQRSDFVRGLLLSTILDDSP